MIQFLNKKIEFYLNILSKGSMHLAFDKFLDFDVSGLKYRSCSSGERKRVDLAVLIALYDLTNLRNKDNYNILVLDEVLDSIDEIGIEAAQELLLELNKRIPTIFVISHNNILGQYFPSTITVVKEKGISRLE
jgi:DNA repair exonuclease SbcCD ATPase subunit